MCKQRWGLWIRTCTAVCTEAQGAMHCPALEFTQGLHQSTWGKGKSGFEQVSYHLLSRHSLSVESESVKYSWHIMQSKFNFNCSKDWKMTKQNRSLMNIKAPVCWENKFRRIIETEHRIRTKYFTSCYLCLARFHERKNKHNLKSHSTRVKCCSD